MSNIFIIILNYYINIKYTFFNNSNNLIGNSSFNNNSIGGSSQFNKIPILDKHCEIILFSLCLNPLINNSISLLSKTS